MVWSGNCCRKWRVQGLFEHVTRYEDPLTYNLKPAYELSMYGAWFARHEKESVMAKEFVDVPIPAWVAETSEREIVSQRGLMARYELKDRRSGEIVAKWYSFSAASFPEEKTKMPVLAQTLLEDEHRAILHSVAADNVTETAHRAVSIMSPPSAGNNEVIAQVPAESESGLTYCGAQYSSIRARTGAVYRRRRESGRQPPLHLFRHD